jgi:hypothetical protein
MSYLLYASILILIIYIFRQLYNKSCYFEKSIQILYRQSARWAAAAIQDDSAIIKVLHANYATGYLWAIKDIVSSSEFQRITGQNFQEFENEIVKVQDSATKQLVDICKPLIFSENPILYKAMYLRPNFS